MPPTAPAVDPISQEELDWLVDFVQDHRHTQSLEDSASSSGLLTVLWLCRDVAVLTGAGCSTESNIPDYRGPAGAYSSGFKPMTHQQVSVS